MRKIERMYVGGKLAVVGSSAPPSSATSETTCRSLKKKFFGPVVSILPYDDEKEATSIANDSTYGLQGYVFSADMRRALRVAAQMEVGRVQVNTLTHEPLAPFGGVKQSGIGRENGVYGLEAFLEPKAILTAI